ncbi:MAG: tetratricopeptide repeat protein [Candidatus Zipacnadales bacterium]
MLDRRWLLPVVVIGSLTLGMVAWRVRGLAAPADCLLEYTNPQSDDRAHFIAPLERGLVHVMGLAASTSSKISRIHFLITHQGKTYEIPAYLSPAQLKPFGATDREEAITFTAPLYLEPDTPLRIIVWVDEPAQQITFIPDTEQAEHRLRELAEGSEASARASYRLGCALAQLKRPDEAEMAYRAAIARDPRFIEARVELGKALLKRGEMAEAGELLQEAVEQAPGEPAAHVALAQWYVTQHDFNNALETLRQAVQAAPGDAVVQMALGDVLSLADKQAEAVQAFERAVELAPEYSATYVMLAMQLWGINDERAVKELRTALAINPLDLECHGLLAAVLEDPENPEPALAVYRETLTLFPDEWTVWEHLAELLEEAQRITEAIEAYREAIKRKPNLASARANLGHLLLVQGQEEEAEDQFRKAIQVWPQCADAHLGLGMILDMQSQRQEALMEYCRAIEADPDVGAAYMQLAWSVEQGTKLAGALAHYRAAVKQNPKNGRLHAVLAALLYHQGQYRAAWDHLYVCARLNVWVSSTFVDDLKAKQPPPKGDPWRDCASKDGRGNSK